MPDKPTKDTHIDRLELKMYVRDILERAGLTTLGAILDKTENELRAIMGHDKYLEFKLDVLIPNDLWPKAEPKQKPRTT